MGSRIIRLYIKSPYDLLGLNAERSQQRFPLLQTRGSGEHNITHFLNKITSVIECTKINTNPVDKQIQFFFKKIA